MKTGKLKLSNPLKEYFENTVLHNIFVLPITEKYLSEYDNVPLMPTPKDPFGRLIIATAVVEKMNIVRVDEQFSHYKKFVEII